MDLPYARFYQVMRVASEVAVEERRERWELAAFSGWQAYITNRPLLQALASAFGGSLGEDGPQSFAEWCEGLGLGAIRTEGGAEAVPAPQPTGPTKAQVMAKVADLLERGKRMQMVKVRVGEE